MNIQTNVSLKPYNTFGIDVSAKEFIEINSVEELKELIKSRDISSAFILGEGSNVLFTKNIENLVIKINIKGIEVISEDSENILIKVGTGENWHEFVLYCVERGYGGIENLSFIPGLVGGAPVQNIGAYGVEVKESVEKVIVVDRRSGEIREFNNAECKFNYRDSIFKNELKNQYIIAEVIFKLSKNPKLNTSYGDVERELALTGKNSEDWTIKDVSNVVTKIRQSKLPNPKEFGNSGSFFKNPIVSSDKFNELKNRYPEIPSYPTENLNLIKIPAAWLIDKLGWKGWRSEDGTYGVHKDHALVLVNYGRADGKNIAELAQKIKESVENKFGITLQSEVNVI